MNQERILQVLVGPHTSEKAAIVADMSNQYVFRVAIDATKLEVKKAVEQLFKVKVDKVSTLRQQNCWCHGKRRAEHAPGHDLEIRLSRRFKQFQGFCQATRLVEFDVDRVIFLSEAVKAFAGRKAFIRANRNRPIH